MNASDIAMLNPSSIVNAASFSQAKSYVKRWGNMEMVGLLSEMAIKIRFERGFDRGFTREYLGGNSKLYADCLKDAEDLLARALLDRSVYPHEPLSRNSINEHIATKAYFIWKKTNGPDHIQNWMKAQREYAQEILAEFEQLQQKEMQKSRESSPRCTLDDDYFAEPE